MIEHSQRRQMLAPALAMVAGLGLVTTASAQANPCAAKNPCAPRAANPCGAKNPCTANPCAAKTNPCAANPCAAKANPCAANPCAAKNPCAANPCAAGAAVTVTPEQATAMYKALAKRLQASYARSGVQIAATYQDWKRYNTKTYQSATHGERYVNNYANDVARDYGKYDGEKVLPTGSVLAKDSIVPGADGTAQEGPLFVMEKMKAGFYAPSADWKYTLVMPDGSVIGETNGQGGANVQFCHECHAAAGASQMFFLPDELRVK
jgi:hypothetical protein